MQIMVTVRALLYYVQAQIDFCNRETDVLIYYLHFFVLLIAFLCFTNSVSLFCLFSLKLQGFGQLLPFPVVGHLNRVASPLLKHVDGIILAGQRSSQVLTAKVVNQLQFGFLLVFDLA